MMNPLGSTGLNAVVTTLRGFRSDLERATANKMDPATIIAAGKDATDALHGTVDELRSFAPALGELWDTLRSLLGAVVNSPAAPPPPAGQGITLDKPADTSTPKK